jgi:transcriptional antiterminator RfaH
MSWVAVQTISGQENTVAERIERIGYATLAPWARFEVNGKEREAAVFPGYLFAEVEMRWYEIRWCVGVMRIIMNGEKPAHVGEADIDKIKRRMGRNGQIKLPKEPDADALVRGASVKILTGSFQGLAAIYQGMSPRDRLLVLLDMLGRKVSVELNAEDRIVLAPALASEPMLRY